MDPINNIIKKGRANIIKILCLAVGLTAALLLIAKVHFDSTFDTYFPGHDRVYLVYTNIDKENERSSYSQISGGVAPAMAAEIPEIEAATRFTYVYDSDMKYAVENIEDEIVLNMAFADSLWFDVFSINILAGNPREILAKPLSTMISHSKAEQLGGIENVIGKIFHPKGYENINFTIEGVFEDFPDNSTIDFDAISSLGAYSERSTTNWIGNDRYVAYAKLREGAEPKSLKSQLRQMQERHVDMSELEKAGVDISYELRSIYTQHKDDEKISRINNLMLAIATLLILTAVLNYILIVLSTMIKRTKEIAVKKCYGSSATDITLTIAGESMINLFAALAIGAALAYVFRDKIENMLGVSYQSLLTVDTLLILCGVIVSVLILTVAIPAWVFVRIPVSAAFRSEVIARRKWKSALLFVEMTATAYVAIMVVNVSHQYHFMLNADMGYEIDNLMYYNDIYVSDTQIESIMTELQRLPEVETVTRATTLPVNVQSGNNVSLPDDDRELFNFADLYFVGDDYFKTMGIEVTEGHPFDKKSQNNNSVMVSESFADKMHEITGNDNSIIGQELILSEHSDNAEQKYTVTGVYENIQIGTIRKTDTRPSVLFSARSENCYFPAKIVLIRLHDMNQESIAAVNGVISKITGNANSMAEPYHNLTNQYYQQDKNLRDSIICCCLIALTISLTGVAGFVADEISRRRREIAVHKVNGATSSDILRKMISQFAILAIPALCIGTIAAWYSTELWLQNYSRHASLSIPLILLALLSLLCLIIGIVLSASHRAANENPIKALYQN